MMNILHALFDVGMVVLPISAMALVTLVVAKGFSSGDDDDDYGL